MADVAAIALQTCITNWAAALQADSVSPQPSYMIDGKSVSRSEWRTSLQQLIADAQDTINQRSPTITWTGCFHPWGW